VSRKPPRLPRDPSRSTQKERRPTPALRYSVRKQRTYGANAHIRRGQAHDHKHNCTGAECTYKRQIETQKGFVVGHGDTWLRSCPWPMRCAMGDRLPCAPTRPAAALVHRSTHGSAWLHHRVSGCLSAVERSPLDSCKTSVWFASPNTALLTSCLEFSNDAMLDSGQYQAPLSLH
jgi:hypothetical protein